MNTRLVKLLIDRGQLEHADMLDCYNQSVLKDIAITKLQGLTIATTIGLLRK